MTAIDLEITAAQVALFQRTGRLLDVAEEVRRDREKLLQLLRAANEYRTLAKQTEAPKE